MIVLMILFVLCIVINIHPIFSDMGKIMATGMVTSKVGKRYAFSGFDALKELFLMRLAASCVKFFVL
jgi:hypothetical protein